MKIYFSQKENNILDASIPLFVKYGYDKTSVAEIAKEAGISKGAIYLQFESKEHLFTCLLLRESRIHNEKWLEYIQADPKGGLLSGIYKNQLKAMVSSELMTAIFQNVDVFGSYLKKKKGFFSINSNSTMRKDFVEMLQKVNAVRKDVNPESIAHIMDMISYSLFTASDYKPKDQIPPVDEVIGEIADMMDRAYTPEDGGDSDAGKKVIKQLFDNVKKQYMETEMKGTDQ